MGLHTGVLCSSMVMWTERGFVYARARMWATRVAVCFWERERERKGFTRPGVWEDIERMTKTESSYLRVVTKSSARLRCFLSHPSVDCGVEDSNTLLYSAL